MIDFPTVYNKLDLHPIMPSEPGNPEVHKYGSRADSNGHIDVYDIGVEYDMRDYIQSWKDSVDIEILMRRFKAGEQDALERIKGVYGDFTNMPTNLADMYNRLQEGKEMFDRLDPALKEKFSNNPLEFFTQLGSDEFNKKIDKFIEDNRPIEQTAFKTTDVTEEMR